MKTYITIDGGTTNTRLSFIQDGKTLETIKINCGSNPTTSAQLKVACKETIAQLIQKYGKPSVILGSGMLTSEFGLCEVKHQITPVGIEDFHKNMYRVNLPDIADIPFVLMAGVKTNEKDFMDNNVMRGEETELIGLVDELEPNVAYVLPGSHSKLIRVNEEGKITGIRSFLTGEMTVALSQHTILANAVNIKADLDEDMLHKGYLYAKLHGLNEALFKVRTLQINKFNESQMYSFYIGCIMQGEVQEIAKIPEKKIYIGGQKQLKEILYILLKFECDKEIVCFSDESSKGASEKGMMKIYEYSV